MAEAVTTKLVAGVARGRARRVAAWLQTHALLIGLTAALAAFTIRRVLQAAGEPAAPLDDTFIHFQYAKSFAELHPFQYSAGAEPVSGATSLLWPLLLSIPYALGLRGSNLMWAAWFYAWSCLLLLSYETRKSAERLTSRAAGLAAGAMVFAFGGYIWFASSGMEVVPLAWLLMRTARRAAEWIESTRQDAKQDDFDAEAVARELVVLAWVTPAMRPEGALASLMAAAALAFGRPGRRWFGLLALAGVGLTPLVNLMFTGHATTTTALVKWLPLSPYQEGSVLYSSVVENIKLLFGTLLDGRVWSSVFLPQGIAWLAVLCVPALLIAGVRRQARARSAFLALVALGMLIPTTYDSFLWNRLRYLWPFAAAWFVGMGALCDLVAEQLARVDPRLIRLRPLLAGVPVGALAGHLPYAIDDVAVSAAAIDKQQVALGRWAKDSLPKDALIGVNDTGAIAYFSGHRVFDVVGLTTSGEARYWAAGAGSRFEHYEKMPGSSLPTHFIVYPEWFAIPALQGEWLTERRVPGATILGGETMMASRAEYSALRSAEAPLASATDGLTLVDRLDVADLESEAQHEYELLPAAQGDDVAIEHDGRVDGARNHRTRDAFQLDLAAGGTLIGRIEVDVPVTVTIRARGKVLGEWRLSPGEFREYALDLRQGSSSGRQRVELLAESGTFNSLHYWSYRGP